MLLELANHLWQSTLFLIGVAALCHLLRGDGAHIRYWLWWVGSVKFLVPFSLLTAIGTWISDRAAVGLESNWTSTFTVVARPFESTGIELSAMTLLLAAWALGTLLVLGRWAHRGTSLSRALRRADEQAPIALGEGRSVRVYRTHENIEPGVVGLFRATLLLPAGLESRLSASQLEAVIAHELAHVRRRDNLTAAVHMLVEAVFWFHPLVWWVGSRLIDERERACDESVVALGHDRATYAESILNVCEHHAATRLACAPGISGSDLKRRMVAIMSFPGTRPLRRLKKLLLTAASLAALTIPVLAGLMIEDIAVAQQVAPDPVDSAEYLPIVKVAPVYPPQAVADRIEGRVVVQYSVMPDGSTANVRVLESSNPIFDQPSIESALKYKYKPRVVNGEAVQVDGVTTMLVFELESDAPAAPPAPPAPPAPRE